MVVLLGWLESLVVAGLAGATFAVGGRRLRERALPGVRTTYHGLLWALLWGGGLVALRLAGRF